MRVELREIDRSNWLQCIKLNVGIEQRDFVVPTAWSLVKAAYEPESYPFGIYCDDELVGYVMYSHDSDIGVWEMVDLMVDEAFQGRGIGKAAVAKLLELATLKLGHISFCTSVAPANTSAIALYEKLGFKLTGRMIYGELQMEIQL